ncbi:MAG TPA: peptidoglycan-binding protein [Candidatus Udaeobacter sp.]|nr:peptidoglycan-binding protein [Candidatus Udaeobacter sp.]
MNLLRFPLLCPVAVLAIGISTGTSQTTGSATQNAPRAASNGGRTANVRPNNPQYVHRGPVNIGQQSPGRALNQIQNQPANFRSNYPRYQRQLNPTLTAPGPRQQRQSYNSQSNVEASRGEVAQAAAPATEPQRTVKTGDLEPPTDESKRRISESLEAIDTERVAKNDSVEPTARDLENGQVSQHKGKLKAEHGKNRFSYSDALRRDWHEWHQRDWWKQHCNTIVFVTGGYYFLDSSYWYPAWGYDPYNSYYDYDGPIYTYGNLLPDQVIANVQGALQEAGYYFGAINGSLGVETRTALTNYQSDQGLIVTGAIDEPTVEALGLY